MTEREYRFDFSITGKVTVHGPQEHPALVREAVRSALMSMLLDQEAQQKHIAGGEQKAVALRPILIEEEQF